jgi:hypothetical protein
MTTFARFVFFVGVAQSDELRGYKMQSWDGNELFVRFREKGIEVAPLVETDFFLG